MAGEGRTTPARAAGRRPSAAGFTLVELLVTVAIIAIVAAIAVPNLLHALQRTRRMAAYSSAMQVKTGIHQYMLENDEPPAWLDPTTLEPLVTAQALSQGQRDGILATFEGDEIWWYWGWSGWWRDGGYQYIMAFRVKGETDPWAQCYLWDDALYRWDMEYGWHEPLH
jgi:prepilin-type N-terminal cleavage/methylation domain-containing protein